MSKWFLDLLEEVKTESKQEGRQEGQEQLLNNLYNNGLLSEEDYKKQLNLLATGV